MKKYLMTPINKIYSPILPKLVLSIILASLSISLPAKIYKWTSDDGQIHFSDVPPNLDKKIELIQLKNTGNTATLINKTSNKQNKTLNKKIKNYKKIEQHHEAEDINSFINNIKNKIKKIKNDPEPNNVEIPEGQTKLDKVKDKNCQIAQDNLEQLEKSKIIMDKNKISKLTPSEHSRKISVSKKQINKYC